MTGTPRASHRETAPPPFGLLKGCLSGGPAGVVWVWCRQPQGCAGRHSHVRRVGLPRGRLRHKRRSHLPWSAVSPSVVVLFTLRCLSCEMRVSVCRERLCLWRVHFALASNARVEGGTRWHVRTGGGESGSSVIGGALSTYAHVAPRSLKTIYTEDPPPFRDISHVCSTHACSRHARRVRSLGSFSGGRAIGSVVGEFLRRPSYLIKKMFYFSLPFLLCSPLSRLQQFLPLCFCLESCYFCP